MRAGKQYLFQPRSERVGLAQIAGVVSGKLHDLGVQELGEPGGALVGKVLLTGAPPGHDDTYRTALQRADVRAVASDRWRVVLEEAVQVADRSGRLGRCHADAVAIDSDTGRERVDRSFAVWAMRLG